VFLVHIEKNHWSGKWARLTAKARKNDLLKEKYVFYDMQLVLFYLIMNNIFLS